MSEQKRPSALHKMDESLRDLVANDFLINSLYLSDSHTWSDTKIALSPAQETHSEIADTFNVFEKLTFLGADETAEKEADQFFSKIPMKTKKIRVNKRA